MSPASNAANACRTTSIAVVTPTSRRKSCALEPLPRVDASGGRTSRFRHRNGAYFSAAPLAGVRPMGAAPRAWAWFLGRVEPRQVTRSIAALVSPHTAAAAPEQVGNEHSEERRDDDQIDDTRVP